VFVALLLAGCGGDGNDTTTSAQPDSPPRTRSEPSPEQRLPQEPAPESRPSRRDTEVQEGLARHLREESLGGAAGWRAADVGEVHVRATSVTIRTRLRPARRDAANALCLTARRYFLGGAQGQTAYDVLVTGRDSAPMAGC
jgi:hypothetical protein